MSGKVKLSNMVPLMKAAEMSARDGKPAAIGAFNINFYTQAEGVLEGLRRADAPGIIQASRGANKFQGGPDKIQYMLLLAMKNSGHDLPVTLHLDHGTKEAALDCVDKGFSSVMIDGSEHEFDGNVAETKGIVDYAHPKGVSVEGEYGKLAGVEEDVEHETTTYADPKEVVEFFKRSKADALAVAYGTSHGPNKGSNIDALKTSIVKDSYDKMAEAGLTDDHFLVGHGSSTVPKELVDEINQYGGGIKNAHGVPMGKIKEAIGFGLRKINIDTDLRLAITAVMRKYLQDNPGVEDKYPDTLGRIKKAFDGEIEMVAKGKVQDPKGVIDPRGYFGVLDVAILRDPPTEESGLIEVMDLVKERLASHVEMLLREFGAVRLASKVE